MPNLNMRDIKLILMQIITLNANGEDINQIRMLYPR